VGELGKGTVLASGLEPELLTVSQINNWVGTIDEDRHREKLSLARIKWDPSGQLEPMRSN
jgi:hypothetical protein